MEWKYTEEGKAWRRTYHRAYRIVHLEDLRAKERIRHLRSGHNALRKRYRLLHLNEERKKQRDYSAKNRDKLRAYGREYYRNHKQKWKDYTSKHQEALALGRMMLAAQSMEAIIQNKAV